MFDRPVELLSIMLVPKTRLSYYFVPSCEGLRPDVSVGVWRVMQFEYFSSVLCFYDSMNQFKHCPFVTSFSVSPFFDGDIFEVSMLF